MGSIPARSSLLATRCRPELYLPAFTAAFSTIGYRECADGSLRRKREKIVIYTNAFGGVEHIARQLPDGRWTSKLGDEEYIIHETPQSLSVGYGGPTCYMQRPRKDNQCWIGKIIQKIERSIGQRRSASLPMRTPLTERTSTLY
jgi:hypothetical protein